LYRDSIGRLRGLLNCGSDKNRLEALELHQNFVLPEEQEKRTKIAIGFFSEKMDGGVRLAAFKVLAFLARSNLLDKNQLSGVFTTFKRLAKKKLVDSSYTDTLFEFVQQPCDEETRFYSSKAILGIAANSSLFNGEHQKLLAYLTIFESNSDTALNCRKALAKLLPDDKIFTILKEAGSNENKIEFLSDYERFTGPQSEEIIQRALDFLGEGDKDVGLQCHLLINDLLDDGLVKESHMDRLVSMLSVKDLKTVERCAWILQDCINSGIKLSEEQIEAIAYSIPRMSDFQFGLWILDALKKTGQISENDSKRLLSAAVSEKRMEYLETETRRREVCRGYKDVRVPKGLVDEAFAFARKRRKAEEKRRPAMGKERMRLVSTNGGEISVRRK